MITKARVSVAKLEQDGADHAHGPSVLVSNWDWATSIGVPLDLGNRVIHFKKTNWTDLRLKMARSRDRRGSQRSEWSDEFRDDFEEPNFFRQQPARSTAPGVDAVVLWFNAEKGFGFVETPDGKAFLHTRQLEAAGYTTVAEGTPIKAVIQPGDKGRTLLKSRTLDRRRKSRPR